jgi:hypothetical protein
MKHCHHASAVERPLLAAEAPGGPAQPLPGRILGPRREAKMLDLAEDAAHKVGVQSRRRVATYRAYMLDKGRPHRAASRGFRSRGW